MLMCRRCRGVCSGLPCVPWLYWGSGMNRNLCLMFASAICATVILTAVTRSNENYSPPRAMDAPTTLTFNKDVAPVIYANCSVCHHPGGSAPFSLMSYQDVKMHAPQVVAATRSRLMPPWLPEPGYGTFVGERRLTEQQIRTLGRWEAEGAKEGVDSDLPPAPKFFGAWQLGRPDLIVRVPQPYILLAGGNTESWPRFELPIHISGTHFVKGIEIHPGNPRIVHHCYIVTDRTGVTHLANGEVYQLGPTGMENKFTLADSELDSRFLTWRPGTPPYFEPEGATWRLDKETDLTLVLHLMASGKPQEIQPAVAFYFSKEPPTKFTMIVHLEHDGAIDIPPGAMNYVVADDLRLPVDVKVLSILPHGHYLCRRMRVFATLPDGSRRWLIWIKKWNFDWQGVFRYVQPVSLPKGTIISMRYAYDNSIENPLNPNRPPKRVLGGPKSTDEMADLWLEVLPAHKEDLFALEIAMMERRIAKYPKDLEGYADLGAALRAQGRNREALVALRKAARLKPDDVQVQNNLGAVLGSLGQLDEAILHLRKALRIRPDYFLAYMNLGSALRLRDDLTNSIASFQRAVELKPDSAEAHDKLGLVYAQQGNLAEAITQFRDAVGLDPNDSFARASLTRAEETLKQVH